MNMTNADWAASGMWPTFQSPNHLDVYDIRGASQDTQLSITTMTGVINRQQAQVYLLSSADAAFWFQEVFAQIPHDVSLATGNAALDTLLNSYGSSIQGMIIYDPNCIDSINIATMLAGQRDGMVVSPAQAVVLQGPPYQLPVIADLRIYQWKSRVQVYSWAEVNLLKDAAPNLIAGLDPKISGALRSFLVATRTCIYWLEARDFLPDIPNGLASERGLMQRIFSAFPAGTIHLGWFIDEPHGVTLTSKAAMPVLASDFFENLEVWTSVQNVQGTAQARNVGTGLASSSATDVEIVEDQGEAAIPDQGSNVGTGLAPSSATDVEIVEDQGSNVGMGLAPSSTLGLAPAAAFQSVNVSAVTPKAYVSFTISDGDNLQYDQHRMAGLWRDPVRGSIPIGWTISPSLVQTAPSLAAYYMGTASLNDELIAGPSGAGYMYPSDWPQVQLPAFLKPGLQTAYVDVLTPFGLKGILSGSGQTQSSWKKVSGVPVLQNLGLADSVSKTVNLVRNASAHYLNMYVMAWTMTPSDLKQVVQQLGSEYEVVTPGRLLEMIA